MVNGEFALTFLLKPQNNVTTENGQRAKRINC